MTPINLDEIERLAKAATQGPWFFIDFTDPKINDAPTVRDVYVSCDWPAPLMICSMEHGLEGTLEEARANAAFIAHAREAVPALVARIRELEAVAEFMLPYAKNLSCLYNKGPEDWCDHTIHCCDWNGVVERIENEKSRRLLPGS